jgi:hypothetical protein
MVSREERYNLESVEKDVHSFFQYADHWAYQYGTKATFCDNDSVFYMKQIEVIFEDRYPHDITGKAVKRLAEDGFLRQDERYYREGMSAIFVWRRDLRWKATEMKQKLQLMAAFTDDEVNDGCGKYAEILFSHMFDKNGFEIVARHANKVKGKKWTKSGRNLDFVIEKDGILYGVEVKNRFDYMKPDEFADKVEMCQFLGLLPVFPIRCPSPSQFTLMGDANGLALKFKTRIFPPSRQKLVTDVWNNFRLPVNVWERILPPIEKNFLDYHKRQCKRIDKKY